MAPVEAQARGHDWGAPLLDTLGIFYIVLATVYALAVIAGVIALFIYRHKTAVKIRSFWLTAVAVLLLLVYAAWVIVVYPLNGLFKCDTEFWVMSLFLPTSIALFQACNVRLLSYYNAQQELTNDVSFYEKARQDFKRRETLRERLRQMSTLHKTYMGIGVGLVIQEFIVTLVLYYGSRKFRDGTGFFGTHVGPAQCRRGYEWIPSVFWQFLWVTVLGPAVLLKTRHIHDARNWAWQTRLAIVACIPGTPLWLLFLYNDDAAIHVVDQWLVPAMWFVPGLMTMQFVSLYYPLLDVYRATRYEKLRCSGCSNLLNHCSRGSKTHNRDLYSMASLEMQIEKNVDPLLRWAAQKEFTAENIVFLRAVRDFKKRWASSAKCVALSMDQQRERYEEAALIFFTLVNPSTARFNINVDHRTYLELNEMFAGCEYHRFDEDSSSYTQTTRQTSEACPWDKIDDSSTRSDETTLIPTDVDKLYPVPVTEISTTGSSLGSSTLRSTLADTNPSTPLKIPRNFSADIFDKAYNIVKEDVFLNTWARYEARFATPRAPSPPRPSGGEHSWGGGGGAASNSSRSRASLLQFRKSDLDLTVFTDSWNALRCKV